MGRLFRIFLLYLQYEKVLTIKYGFMKEPKLKKITIDYRVELEFDVRHIPRDVLDAMCKSEDDSDTWGSEVDKDNELAMKATAWLDKNLKFGKRKRWWYSLNDYNYEME